MDWDNLPDLECPRRKSRDPHDRERLARVALRRRKHKPSKAHGTGKKSAAIRRRKKSKAAHVSDENARELAGYRSGARAYWNGETDVHP